MEEVQPEFQSGNSDSTAETQRTQRLRGEEDNEGGRRNLFEFWGYSRTDFIRRSTSRRKFGIGVQKTFTARATGRRVATVGLTSFLFILSFLAVTLRVGNAAWSGSAGRGESQNEKWYVWMKTSPCSGRTDWVSIAKENPTGGGNAFQIFPGSHWWPTFAAAMTEANTLRTSPLFSSYCCREYSVWQNMETRKFSVVVGKFGNPGPGWRFIKGELCCEEAFAQAGLPNSSSCGAGSGGGCNTHDLSGTWYDSNGLPVVLTRNGNRVTGTYRGGRGHETLTGTIQGTFDGKTLRGTFQNREGNVSGGGNCYFSLTGNRLVGRWEGGGNSGDWVLSCNGGGGNGGCGRGKGGTGNGGGTGGNRGGSGGDGGGSGGGDSGRGTSGGSAQVKLQLVDVTQDPKCSNWRDITGCSSGHIAWGSAVNTDYQWSPPPQQIGPAGFSMTISVSEHNDPAHRSATGIGMDGGGFELSPKDARVPIGAPNQPMSGNMTVKVVPPKNASGDYYLKVGVYWGPNFVYHYRAVK